MYLEETRIPWQKAENRLEVVAHYLCTKIDCTLLESNLETFNIFATRVPATFLKRMVIFFSLKEKLQTEYNSTSSIGPSSLIMESLE